MISSLPSLATLVAIRAAHHAETTPSFDRVVFEFSDSAPLIQIEYVPELIADGSGTPVVIAGQAVLRVSLAPARAHDDNGHMIVPNRLLLDLLSVTEVVCAGDFEGVVDYGIGIRQKADVRILTMADPGRLVIDIMQPLPA